MQAGKGEKEKKVAKQPMGTEKYRSDPEKRKERA